MKGCGRVDPHQHAVSNANELLAPAVLTGV
jgi:hypothetical protein